MQSVAACAWDREKPKIQPLSNLNAILAFCC